jgi:hypothetical protein
MQIMGCVNRQPKNQCWLMKYTTPRYTVIARISVTFSTLHSFISVKKNFYEHVYLTQKRMNLSTRDPNRP